MSEQEYNQIRADFKRAQLKSLLDVSKPIFQQMLDVLDDKKAFKGRTYDELFQAIDTIVTASYRLSGSSDIDTLLLHLESDIQYADIEHAD